jgi:hypothetical protein
LDIEIKIKKVWIYQNLHHTAQFTGRHFCWKICATRQTITLCHPGEGLTNRLKTGISCKVDFEMGLKLGKRENKTLTDSQHRRVLKITTVPSFLYMMTVWENRYVFRRTGTPDSRTGPRSMKYLVPVRFFIYTLKIK